MLLHVVLLLICIFCQRTRSLQLSSLSSIVPVKIVAASEERLVGSSGRNDNRTAEDVAKALDYLDSEVIAAAEALTKLRAMLRDRGIHIDPTYAHDHHNASDSSEELTATNRTKPDIIMSTEENNIECRVSLSRVPFGRKALAPCGCIGSQKWVQYSVFNRLRRKEPSHWKTCKVGSGFIEEVDLLD
jgi:hypothetical protein